MAKYINAEDIFFSYKEEEVAAEYDGKNDISTGVLFALDTISEMPESIVRCKDCKYRIDLAKICACPMAIGWDALEPEDNDFCSRGERRSE